MPHPTKPDSISRPSPLNKLPPGAHALVWGVMVALILILAAVSWNYRGQKVWEGWRESGELRHPIYTERIYMDDAFRTQANTWSNLAYVLVGLYALAYGWQDLRPKHPPGSGYVKQTPAMSLLFGAVCCYLGVGSGLFHASLTRWGQQLDVAAMYSPQVVFIVMNLGQWGSNASLRRRHPTLPLWPFLVGLAVLASFLLYCYKWSMSSGVVLPALLAIMFSLIVVDQFRPRGRRSFRWLVLGVIAFALAVVCRQLDVAGRFTGPDSWFQGHAFWHGLSAGALGYMYLYYRFEMPSGRPESVQSCGLQNEAASKPGR